MFNLVFLEIFDDNCLINEVYLLTFWDNLSNGQYYWNYVIKGLDSKLKSPHSEVPCSLNVLCGTEVSYLLKKDIWSFSLFGAYIFTIQKFLSFFEIKLTNMRRPSLLRRQFIPK